jgi:lysophospholipid acyltransferase (LPLAT)-like uncharacterized protein
MSEEKLTAPRATDDAANGRAATPEISESPRAFTTWQRFQIFLASWAGAWACSLVGRSLRWEVHGWDNWEAARRIGPGMIYVFWHREIFPATWFWRRRGIVVMTSQNFDGELIARIIERHGFRTARGSSSHGAIRAFAELKDALEGRCDVAFTIDGPRGPRFVAKPGPVLLAKLAGAPLFCFHIAVARGHVFTKAWDLHKIPYPFSRAAVFMAPPIVVPPETAKRDSAAKLAELQAALEGLQKRGEEWISKLSGTNLSP